ncbi:MAG: prepilin-type N-terminal cleavage/methylation domain-containing protein [Merismopedia sp. SIO2A8]|nr:prepilin-type N-terminal cleavage/methylation domain-containing protein [Merismopedia sp. SIO2A8]
MLKHLLVGLRTYSRQIQQFEILSPKFSQSGLTLLELMVVLVIGGILSAIALPSLTSHALKARETEARLYVATINKDQQRHFMENGEFSATLTDLALGIPVVTKHYTYSSRRATDSGTGIEVALTEADQADTKLRSFSGQVWIGASGNNLLTTSVFCEGAIGAPPPLIASHQCQ